MKPAGRSSKNLYEKFAAESILQNFKLNFLLNFRVDSG